MKLQFFEVLFLSRTKNAAICMLEWIHLINLKILRKFILCQKLEEDFEQKKYIYMNKMIHKKYYAFSAKIPMWNYI